MNTHSRSTAFVALGMALAACQMTGCTPDEEHRDIPPAVVKPVSTPYGFTLDENATPQQVAFVFLRSVADDVHAAQSHQKEAQKQAMRLTHALVAYAAVESRLVAAENMARAQGKNSFGEQRDEKLYDYARQLAPIIAHYVPSFDTDFSAAAGKLRLGSSTASSIHVYYEASHDPTATDVKQRDPVIIDIELVKESAEGKSYWRVSRVGYAGRPTSVTTGTRMAVPPEVAERLTSRPATAIAP